MKHIIYNIAGLSLSAMMALCATSCNDYLDHDPALDVSETVAFENFKNFQGFVEQMYKCIPEKESCFWCTTFNWGEDEIMNEGAGNSHLSHHMDIGDYRHWTNDAQNYLGGNGVNINGGKFDHRIYDHAWQCIRIANMGIEAMDKGYFVGSKEEQNIILGQCYFFRAWWHNEVMMYFGGMPYIEKVYDSNEEMSQPRLTYQECARKAADDFKKAASLLPLDWDKSGPGSKTTGHNQIRVTRTAALGYAGKCLLWAASPLMENHDTGVIGNPGDLTYKYNSSFASEAAECLATAIAEVEAGKTPYGLCDFKYDDIYNHERTPGTVNNFTDIFYTTSNGWKQAGSIEAIFRGPQPDVNGTPWNFAKLWGSKINGFVEHDKVIHMPTANYINYAYGMANGLPITDPESGFDPTHPFRDRDPRFYHDIVFDGMRVATTEISEKDAERSQQYADFQTGSELRNEELGSRTGYFCQKLNSKSNNKYDKMYDWNGALEAYLPYMRLADLYLMYAEALVAANKDFNKAIAAINVLRNRVGAAEVAEKFTTSREVLMDEIRRERACELSFEGMRWNDLQRWLLLTDPRYNKKTSQEFTRVKANGKNDNGIVVENAWYRDNDPRDGEVKGWSEKVICERLLGIKHYWFPLPNKDIYLYPELSQNPGW